MTNRYYYHQPREFANEYTIFVVDNDNDEESLRTFYPDAVRITRKRAIYLGCTRPAEARFHGLHLDGGFESGGLPVGNQADALIDALLGTRMHLNRLREWAAVHENDPRALDLDTDVLPDEEFQQQVEDVIGPCF